MCGVAGTFSCGRAACYRVGRLFSDHRWIQSMVVRFDSRTPTGEEGLAHA